jgi:hypothetical protein
VVSELGNMRTGTIFRQKFPEYTFKVYTKVLQFIEILLDVTSGNSITTIDVIVDFYGIHTKNSSVVSFWVWVFELKNEIFCFYDIIIIDIR